MGGNGESLDSKFRRTSIAVLIVPALLLLSAGQTQAFEIQSGNPDVEMRFDNTLRYNTGWRTRDRNPGIANNPGFDEGDFRFDKGDMITNRLDLYTEFDYTYQKQMGFRISTAMWYDSVYGDRDKSNPLLPATNYPGNNYTDYVKRFYGGPSGEILDAFVWSNFKIADTDLTLKLGRHAVLWGEATFGTASANSVAVDMAPADLAKQTISPGSTAKETTLPINQMTGTWQLTDNFSVSGQYTFEWRPSRVPEGGTFFGAADAILYGPPLVSGAGPLASRVDQIEGDTHDKGVALKWRPDFVDGNFGLYYRKYASKSPIWAANLFNAGGFKGIAVYPSNISLWGLSFGSTIMGTAVGAEISHRHNTPLNMNPGSLTNAGVGFEGPRGDTWHALVNTTTLFNQTDYWTNATLVLELSYQQLDKLTRNPTFYKSVATTPGACTLDAIVKGCSTKEAYHFAALFSPVWAQVYPQADLTGNFVFQQGLKGNAPTTGIAEGATVLSLGLQVDYAVVNRFTLTYTNFWGKTKYLGSASAAGPFQNTNGQAAILGDRDNISFTYAHYF
jgi:hypothetical protein